MERAILALDGLSVGDCFGEQFFGPTQEVVPRIIGRAIPPTPWSYTDDTEMALSIVEVLAAHGEIVQDDLATRFAGRMTVARGYGAGAYQLLMGIKAGGAWRSLSRNGFNGMGSFGNGAAMRVAPLGAYFAAEPLEKLVRQATLSAEVPTRTPKASPAQSPWRWLSPRPGRPGSTHSVCCSWRRF